MDELTLSQDEALGMAVACTPSHDGLTVLQTAHKLFNGSATAQTILLNKLADASSAVEEIDSFIHVCRSALEAQDSRLETNVAAVLRVAHDKAKAAADSIDGAISLLREVSRG